MPGAPVVVHATAVRRRSARGAVVYHDDGSTTLDPLRRRARAARRPCSSCRRRLIANLIVGSAVGAQPTPARSAPQEVQLLDPATGKVVRSLGAASSDGRVAGRRPVDRRPLPARAVRAARRRSRRARPDPARRPRRCRGGAARWSAVAEPATEVAGRTVRSAVRAVAVRPRPSRKPERGGDASTLAGGPDQHRARASSSGRSPARTGRTRRTAGGWSCRSTPAAGFAVLLWHAGLTASAGAVGPGDGEAAFAPLVEVAAD